MTNSYSVRWLHLSDFHIGKDEYGQRQLLSSILKHVRTRNQNEWTPDLIFITGDIAQAGKEEQYEIFLDNFLFPLEEIVKEGNEFFNGIFMVPGNHDVDRTVATLAHRYDALDVAPEFLDPTKKGAAIRQSILPRFLDYADFNFQGDWLSSKNGCFTEILTIREQHVGLVGLNTAWLSGGKNDRNKLFMGKEIVQDALTTIKDCDVKIILGHHPLNWLSDDEIDPIRALFGQNNVIYLHGHMHRSQAMPEYGGGKGFVSMQSGAAFQAREDDKWVNRILWCSLWKDQFYIEAEPMQWSKLNQEWSLDGQAFPESYRRKGTDKWLVPLARKQKVETTEPRSELDLINATSQNIRLPNGWIRVDDDFLTENTSELSEEDLLRYFDGRVPTWKHTISPRVPRRGIVFDLTQELEKAVLDHGMSFFLLLGAGGEGKSTVLQQVACELIASGQKWNILWHNDTESTIDKAAIMGLPKSAGNWLIISDEADVMTRDLFDLVQTLYQQNRGYIHFLMCCRDTDWLAADGNKLSWRDYVNFHEKRLRGLSIEDSRLIIEAWSQCGDKGLGELKYLSKETASVRLSETAKSESAFDSNEGAFLGAMLRLRLGGTLKSRVKALLYRLSERRVQKNGASLLEAFSYIAVPHSYNVLYLSKTLLSKVLSCKTSKVKQFFLGPLGTEAAAVASGQLVLTRHRAIAEVAVEVMEEIFHMDSDEILIELVRAACISARTSDDFIPELREWRFLSSFFFNKGNEELGIRLARTACEADPNNNFLLVHLARLYRGANQATKSFDIFYNFSGKNNMSRACYTEWGLGAASEDLYNVSVCLLGISISDNVKGKNITLSYLPLPIISSLFIELYKEYNEPVFREAFVASIQLLKMKKGILGQDSYSDERKINKTGIETLLQRNDIFLKYAFAFGDEEKISNSSNSVEHDVSTKIFKIVEVLEDPVLYLNHSNPIEKVEKGLISSWEYREKEFPSWIICPEDLSFLQLKRLFQL